MSRDEAMELGRSLTENVDGNLTSCPEESHGSQRHNPAEGHL